MAKLDYNKLNAAVRYVMFSAFAVKPGVLAVSYTHLTLPTICSV